MKKLSVLALILLLFSGCSALKESKDSISKPVSEESSPENDPVEELLDSMTLEEKLGQMLFVGIDGTEISSNTQNLISDYNVGGVILFQKNIGSDTQVKSLLDSIKLESSQNRVPLFLGVDQEGGIVSRLPSEILDTPSARDIGRSGDSSYAFEIGSDIGTILNRLGFNLDFAPVLDIDSNPDNPVIGSRSFGPDPDTVSEMGIAFMNGLSSESVIPVVKHFPGHGDTSVDSHLDLPRVDKNLETLKEFELIPFKRAIDGGADMVMVAHILFSKLDSAPSTLSSVILEDILRDELDFEGVIITDDMTMGAIAERYTVEDAVVKSIVAGSDIALVCHEYENAVNSFESLKQAVDSGLLSKERVDESVYRILKLKAEYNLD